MEYAFAQESAKIALKHDAFDAIISAGIVVQITLLLLIILSVLSWAIYLSKKREFNSIQNYNNEFFKIFWNSKSLDSIFTQAKNFSYSSAAQIFIHGFTELQRIAESDLSKSKSGAPKLVGLDNLQRATKKAIDTELEKFERRVGFLATVASNAPFIGLFGTVWGIMTAFQKIGITGSAQLAVVAPGISEALIATAIGLLTSIPAGIFYNNILSKMRKLEVDLNNFSSDFLNIAKRNFFKDE